MKLASLLFAGLGALDGGRRLPAQRWPVITAVDTSATFQDAGKGGADTPFRLALRTSVGTEVYRLECHNGNFESLIDINFSGDFHCALFALSGGTTSSGNLLATGHRAQQHSDWMNRGRVIGAQLYGECARVTDFGDTRRFRMRGMRLTLEFRQLRWGLKPRGQRVPALMGFTFRVRVAPDLSAQTPSAAPAKLGKADPRCQFPLGG